MDVPVGAVGGRGERVLDQVGGGGRVVMVGIRHRHGRTPIRMLPPSGRNTNRPTTVEGSGSTVEAGGAWVGATGSGNGFVSARCPRGVAVGASSGGGT